MIRLLLLGSLAAAFWAGCSAHHPWRVAPSPSGYALTDGKQSEPYAQMLERYNRFETGSGWIDLKPYMRIQIENAYYEPGKPKRGLDGFIGTELVWYRKPVPPGLIEGAVTPKMLAPRPPEDPAVQTLLPPASRGFGAYRLFFSIRVNRRGATRGAVLLGAPNESDLSARAAALLADPDSVCREGAADCTVFPEVCTVSPQIEVSVNGGEKVFVWGTPLSAAVGEAKQVRLTRLLAGKRSSVPIDAADKNALRLPLLPGDEIRLD